MWGAKSEGSDITSYDDKSLLKKIEHRINFIRKNTKPQKNTELYEYLRKKYGARKDDYRQDM